MLGYSFIWYCASIPTRCHVSNSPLASGPPLHPSCSTFADTGTPLLDATYFCYTCSHLQSLIHIHLFAYISLTKTLRTDPRWRGSHISHSDPRHTTDIPHTKIERYLFFCGTKRCLFPKIIEKYFLTTDCLNACGLASLTTMLQSYTCTRSREIRLRSRRTDYNE